AWEDREQQDLGVRKVMLHLEYDSAYAFGDLRRRVRAHIIRTDHEHDRFWLKALPFAIMQSPEHSLRCVAGDGKVSGTDVAEVLLENASVVLVLHPPVSDRIAIEQQIDIAPVCRRHKTFVSRSHPL